jgi:phosphonate transport system substrate-binding protein
MPACPPRRVSAVTPRRRSTLRTLALALVLTCLFPLPACGGASHADGDAVLHIGAIPDQDPQVLQRLNGRLSERLTRDLGVEVAYVPVTDYTAAVTAFRVGDLDLVWFGGLTGVQARQQVPGARPLAQRDIDAHFRSVFIANRESGISAFHSVSGLRRLAGHTFTFGSETSTSGRVMPQHFLDEAGVDVDRFRGAPGYSGSHDATLDLVESGSFDAGVLNAQVWRDRVAQGSVDLDRVRMVWRTPPYHDYHWLARPDLDERFGAGTTRRARRSLLGLDYARPADRAILRLFGARRFVPTRPANYDMVERVGRRLGLVAGP